MVIKIAEILGVDPDSIETSISNRCKHKYGKYETFKDSLSFLREEDNEFLTNLVDTMLINWRKDLLESVGINE